MASIKERLIQYVLRGKDELSTEARKAQEALEALRAEGDALRETLDASNAAKGLVEGLAATERAAERASGVVERAEKKAADLRAELDANPGSRGLATSLRAAEKEAERARKELDRLTGSVEEQRRAAEEAGIDTSNLSDEQVRLAAEAERTRRALEEHNGELTEQERAARAAARAAAENADEVDNAGNAATSAGKKILVFAAAYISLNAAVGLVKGAFGLLRDGMAKVFDEGSAEEQALAQLQAALKSTGNAAGLTAAQLVEMADKLSDSSMFDGEQIIDAQTRLLSYTNIAGSEFPRAMQIVVDQSQRLGMSIEQSAETVGKALQDPVKAMSALGEQGFILSDGQKRLLERLTATGKTAEAQAVIMDMLTESYGGAAAAAKLGTFAGLWKTIDDRFGDFAKNVADSGSFEYIKTKMKEVGDYIVVMAGDGRLDTLATALSDAFIRGATEVERYIKKLGDVDFGEVAGKLRTFVDDSAELYNKTRLAGQQAAGGLGIAWNGLGVAVNSAAALVTGAAHVTIGSSARIVGETAGLFGGTKIRDKARGLNTFLLDLSKAYAAQAGTDLRQIGDGWSVLAGTAEGSAKQQATAAEKATAALKKSADQMATDQAAGAAAFQKEIQELSDAIAQEVLDTSVAGTRAIADMNDALQLIDTAQSQEQLAGLRKGLLKAFQEGRISLEEFQNTTGVLEGKFRRLGEGAKDAALGVDGLARDLKTLEGVQEAIGNAKTDLDILAIRAALKKLYENGTIDAKTYNAEVAKTVTKQTELKGAIEKTAVAGKAAGEQLTNSQIAYNKALEDGILTSEELRRVSGQRMEEERRASGEAMERDRKGVDVTKRNLGEVTDYFGAVLTSARTPLANMSQAALAAFDGLSNISNVDMSMDTSDLEGTTASLKAAEEAWRRWDMSITPGISPFGRWQVDTAMRSLDVQKNFLREKVALQALMEGYADGSITASQFTAQAAQARQNMDLLDESDLSALDTALAGAAQKMQQLEQSSKSTLTSLQEELMGLRGETEALEQSRFNARKADLAAQLAEAQQSGDGAAAANLQQSAATLRQIEEETGSQRAAAERKKQQDAAAAALKAAPPAPAKPTQIIRLQPARGAPVNVTVDSDTDKTNLLSVLESAGLRSL